VLEDDGGRALGEVLQDVQRVVHVGEIRLAGMLAGLEHMRFGGGADEPFAGTAKGHAAKGQAAGDGLVEGGRLIRVLAVAQALDLTVDGPGPLGKGELGLAKLEDEFGREGIFHHGGIHFFQVAHGAPPCVSCQGCLAQPAHVGKLHLEAPNNSVRKA